MIRRVHFVVSFFLFTTSSAPSGLLAGDAPSIQGELRQGIQASMEEFISHQTIGETFRHDDPLDGKPLLHLAAMDHIPSC